MNAGDRPFLMALRLRSANWRSEILMNIEVINACRAVRRYIDRVKNGDSPKNSWEEEVIAEIWERLCCYAPYDLS